MLFLLGWFPGTAAPPEESPFLSLNKCCFTEVAIMPDLITEEREIESVHSSARWKSETGRLEEAGNRSAPMALSASVSPSVKGKTKLSSLS